MYAIRCNRVCVDLHSPEQDREDEYNNSQKQQRCHCSHHWYLI